MADIYNVYKQCGRCGGSGKENNSDGEVDCRVCSGEGRWGFGITEEPDPMPPDVETLNIMKTCGYCGGPGIMPSGITCPMCLGKGKYLWAVMEKQE